MKRDRPLVSAEKTVNRATNDKRIVMVAVHIKDVCRPMSALWLVKQQGISNRSGPGKPGRKAPKALQG
jgi:hypothetical protein